ncbi:uncharacterized protein DUF4234 [Geodermatophilus tzadiensis]|uniref:Uncharacterized protein DUF4234 n=1 Tax=Geodermatophilus tzadiensis TaxID=1137988 RepID=A0A2T0T162_9ACTN|nr:DUF4234 domain-containing protein [Geodermatophilus tzadiensis]PRY39404.1 uncharacterized protein DUF4234 [Geodermatophilus tzadiensis]
MTTSQSPGAAAQQPASGAASAHGQAPYAPAPYGQVPYGQAPSAPAPYGQAPAHRAYAGQPMPPVPAGAPVPQAGPVGRVRGTGVAILLMIVTFGIYGLVWTYSVHEEMRRHTGQGLGGGLALLITIVFGVASPFVASSEVGNLYERMGRAKPVSGATGLWSFPGFLILVGPLVWFVRTNGALNAYWRSLGAA